MIEKTDVRTSQAAPAHQAEGDAFTLPPRVNVFEDADGITLEADIPGVSKDRLHLKVDSDSLLLEGDIHVDVPEGMEPLHADLRAMRYRRSFALSRELDTAGIDASLKDGVLKLRIPKRAEVRPRKIEVRVG